MIFESIGTILDNFNIFGVGIYIVIIGIIFAISRGMGGGSKEQIMIWGITLGMFGTLLLFKDDYIKGLLFITTALIMIIYGLSKLGIKPRDIDGE